MTLEGKTAVVTGGARGIGRAYCERLAKDGANVVIVNLTDPTPVVSALSGPGRHSGHSCDVSEPAQIHQVCDLILEKYGRVDIFVSNAGMLPASTLETLTSETWRKVQATNVEPLMHFAQRLVPGMAAQNWGRIVSTGSSSTQHPLAHDLVYMTSKGGVHALTRSLANEVADRGITVNSIAPTVILTEGFSERTRAAGADPDEYSKVIVAQQTIHRPSVPDDLVGLLAYLVSDDASFVTGQIIHVDGGRTRSGA